MRWYDCSSVGLGAAHQMTKRWQRRRSVRNRRTASIDRSAIHLVGTGLGGAARAVESCSSEHYISYRTSEEAETGQLNRSGRERQGIPEKKTPSMYRLRLLLEKPISDTVGNQGRINVFGGRAGENIYRGTLSPVTVDPLYTPNGTSRHRNRTRPAGGV